MLDHPTRPHVVHRLTNSSDLPDHETACRWFFKCEVRCDDAAGLHCPFCRALLAARSPLQNQPRNNVAPAPPTTLPRRAAPQDCNYFKFADELPGYPNVGPSASPQQQGRTTGGGSGSQLASPGFQSPAQPPGPGAQFGSLSPTGGHRPALPWGGPPAAQQPPRYHEAASPGGGPRQPGSQAGTPVGQRPSQGGGGFQSSPMATPPSQRRLPGSFQQQQEQAPFSPGNMFGTPHSPNPGPDLYASQPPGSGGRASQIPSPDGPLPPGWKARVHAKRIGDNLIALPWK